MKVIGVIGQSNGWGSAIDPVAGTGLNAWRTLPNGLFVPVCDAGVVRPNIGGSTYDMYARDHLSDGRYNGEGPLVDALRAGGVTDDILIVNYCVGGSSSSNWSGALGTPPLAVSVPPTSTNMGIAAYHRLRDAMAGTSAELCGIIIYQGENNCIGGADTPANWATHWTTTCDFFAGQFTFAGALKFVVTRLPATPPGGIFNSSDWATLRTNQATFVSGRTDCVLVDSPDGAGEATEPVHLDADGQTALWQAYAAALLANDFGL